MVLVPMHSTGQRYQHMEPNSIIYLELGSGIHYSGIKAGFELQPRTFLELQALTDGGGLWRKYDRLNDWRILSIVHHLNLGLDDANLILGTGIIQTTEGIKGMFTNDNMGLAPQIGLLYRVSRRSNFSLTTMLPISHAPKISWGVLASYRFHFYFFRPEHGLYLLQ